MPLEFALAAFLLLMIGSGGRIGGTREGMVGYEVVYIGLPDCFWLNSFGVALSDDLYLVVLGLD